ncbi:hypothetical protein [Candidatus Nitrosocosmicus arcticus]|uniref:Uncharacterized protein n=1 Tax=Candidatus Nitrosocosmicus arcticus TaxID=2035267 RepID=A0A557SX93_9ARCH|nr:hypothetical protein [Candidatus Nitrosocosmicus arcticus]TVP41229.1 hypothetical protein NARC_40192 [Candidatus Nitrosocosmicus arcticus]
MENGKITVARFVVYVDALEEYYTFITPVAYNELEDGRILVPPMGKEFHEKVG